MKRTLAAAACVAGLTLVSAPFWADAAPKPPRPAPSYVPGPIAISRVRFEVKQGRVMVTTDLTFPAGRDVREDIDVHVAYGGPGMPIAFDAQLLSTPKGYLVAPVDLAGDKLTTAPSKRSPSHAAFSVGRGEMAGVLVHMPAALLTERVAATGQATLRLREVRDLPASLSDGTREVLARLGSYRGRALVLGLLELSSDEPIARTEAKFCGIEARPAKLFVAASAPGRSGVAPPLAERSANDDLCLRFGPAQPAPAPSSTSPARR